MLKFYQEQTENITNTLQQFIENKLVALDTSISTKFKDVTDLNSIGDLQHQNLEEQLITITDLVESLHRKINVCAFIIICIIRHVNCSCFAVCV